MYVYVQYRMYLPTVSLTTDKVSCMIDICCC